MSTELFDAPRKRLAMHSVVRLSAYSGCLLHYSLNNDQLNLRLYAGRDANRMLTRKPTTPTAKTT